MSEVGHEPSLTRQLSKDLLAIVHESEGYFTDGIVHFGTPETGQGPWMRVEFKDSNVHEIVFNDTVRTSNAVKTMTTYHLAREAEYPFNANELTARLAGVSLSQERAEVTFDNKLAHIIQVQALSSAAKGEIVANRYTPSSEKNKKETAQIHKTIGHTVLECLRQTMFYKAMTPSSWIPLRRKDRK
jgi:hypothetical protein